jgi:hypothetical protein
MNTPSADWLKTVCSHCGKLIKFKPPRSGTASNCPDCERTITLTEATPAQLAAASVKAKTQGGKLPVWLRGMLAVCAGSPVLTIALLAVANWIPTLSLAALWQVYGWYMFAATFVSLCSAGLWILFLVYVFTSSTEMRVLLKEISANSRGPHTPPAKSPEHAGPSAWPTLPRPSIPPEDAKYMPKL